MSRTYVVTGSASGIGATTARMLTERGERVIGIDLKGADVEADLSTASGRLEAALAGDEDRALEIAASFVSDDPMTGYVVYPSSKRALARWVRRESITSAWAGAGIPLNAVAPGTVITPMTADLLATPEGAAMIDASVPMPLNYHQPPESITALLIWLTSVENTHMAGQVIYDDGGADATLRGDDIWSWADGGQ